MPKSPNSGTSPIIEYTHYLIYGTVLEEGEIPKPTKNFVGTLDFDKGVHELNGEAFIMSKDIHSPHQGMLKLN